MDNEIEVYQKQYNFLVGVDEVGRGPVAGPVTVSSFSVPSRFYDEVATELSGITDSKKITPKKRTLFVEKIKELMKSKKVFVCVSSVSAKKIEQVGISAALRAALNRSLEKINPENSFVFLDGSLYADQKFKQETIIKGDQKNWLIGAASVVAKVARDNYMCKQAKLYPEYNFDKHKGYATRGHYEKIKKYGFCELHRKSWVKIDF